MSADHWLACGLIGFVIADVVSFWITNASHARRIRQLEILVMRQDHTRRAYEAELRIAERRRERP